MSTDKTTEEPKYIYLVVFQADYEGYSEPEAAFLSEESAGAWVMKKNSTHKTRTSGYEVLKIMINDA